MTDTNGKPITLEEAKIIIEWNLKSFKCFDGCGYCCWESSNGQHICQLYYIYHKSGSIQDF